MTTAPRDFLTPLLPEGHPRRRRWGRRLLALAALLLGVAASQPRWGDPVEAGVLRGRDLVVVVDLSKSMLARDVGNRTRIEAVRESLLELLEVTEQRGGHRVGLVVFAAEAWLLSPLTADHDYLRHQIPLLDPLAPPPEVLPAQDDSLQSGTNLAGGLRLGVQAHLADSAGFQDLLLLSDGDDPDDLKGLDAGLAAARDASIPIHVIGVGDATRATPLPEIAFGLETRLQAEALQQLARDGRGEYRAWPGEPPRLGEFFREALAPRSIRELTTRGFLRPPHRYHGFLLAGLAALLASWWLRR